MAASSPKISSSMPFLRAAAECDLMQYSQLLVMLTAT